MQGSLTTMVAVLGASAAAPFIGDHLTRWIRVPSVVLEIGLGILIGPAVLGWAREDSLISSVADFGLAMLMFLAGYEIDFQRVRGNPLKLAAAGWVISTVLGLCAGLVIIVFVLIAGVGAWLAMRPRPPRLARLVAATLNTSAQLAVRLTMLVVVTMLWIADGFKLDVLLGAFAAGIIIRLFTSAADEEEVEVVESKLEGIGYGFLVPFFFVVSGMRFDLRSLLSKPTALLLIPACMVLFLVVRGMPTYLLHRRDLPEQQRRALALFASAALPLVVVITNIGVEAGHLTTSTAAAMVAAGMLSVLVFPLVALPRLGTVQPNPQKSAFVP